jgi:hypothetical protein
MVFRDRGEDLRRKSAEPESRGHEARLPLEAGDSRTRVRLPGPILLTARATTADWTKAAVVKGSFCPGQIGRPRKRGSRGR